MKKIKALKEQPVCEELGREMDRFFTSEEYEEAEKAGFGEAHIARHFAQWGAEHLRPADGKKWIYEDEYKKDLERLFNDGKQAMREQMMKEAVEGVYAVTTAGHFAFFPDKQIKDFEYGDKVRIIIVKED